MGHLPKFVQRLAIGTSLFSMIVSADCAAGADSDADIVKKIDQYIRQTWKDNEVEPTSRASGR